MFDINGNGVAEAIVGWSSGSIEARALDSGEVIWKGRVGASSPQQEPSGASGGSGVAALVPADYRLDGRTQLLCCSVDGFGQRV